MRTSRSDHIHSRRASMCHAVLAKQRLEPEPGYWTGLKALALYRNDRVRELGHGPQDFLSPAKDKDWVKLRELARAPHLDEQEQQGHTHTPAHCGNAGSASLCIRLYLTASVCAQKLATVSARTRAKPAHPAQAFPRHEKSPAWPLALLFAPLKPSSVPAASGVV